ncbi:hypothetical protein D3C74_186270 [compost metagenome]
MQVYSPIKSIVQDLKKEIELKNESEVIAYLYCIYKQNKNNLKLEDHKKALKEVEVIINQTQL